MHRFINVAIIIKRGPLEKWLNSYPSQGYIHGFEPHTGHHTNYDKDYYVILFNFFNSEFIINLTSLNKNIQK